jgi:threonine dehydrogenase-like Zn-dependent dehydrogenase
VSVPGVYGGFLDKVPFGAAMQKGLTFKMGQTHVHKYVQPLFERIGRGEIDPSFVITHEMPLVEAPYGYQIFNEKKDGCIKIVLKP